MTGWDFVVRKDDLQRHALHAVATDDDLAEGELALRVEAFALTANTLTYALTGDSLGYWRFYPVADPALGRIPAWGYAEVIASAHPELAAGERLFGYVPMSTHARMRASQVRAGSLMDASPHRRALPPAYNFYRRLGPAAAPLSDDEALRAVLDPLFFTSFLIDDLIAERGWDLGAAVVLTSASSKTALGTAFLLHARRPAARIVGLTSARNRGFVEQLGLYDDVRVYGDHALAGERITAIDFAGDAPLLARLAGALGPRLAHVLHVGATHGQLGATHGERFFAPDRIADRSKRWGAAVLDERHDAAWARFLPYARRTIRLERAHGPAALAASYDELAAGGLAPDRACFVQP